MPERGSRCFGASFNCFIPNRPHEDVESPVKATSNPAYLLSSSPLSSPSLAALDEALCSSLAEISADSIDLQTPLGHSDDEEDEDEDEDHDKEESEQHEDREWEQCMERRRMMFARMCKRAPGASVGASTEDSSRYPEFEGYQSVFARIHEVMKSAGCDLETCDEERSVEEACGDEEEEGNKPRFPVVRRMSAENLKLVEDGSALNAFTRTETPSLASLSTDASDEILASPFASARGSVDDAAIPQSEPVDLAIRSSAGKGLGLGMERTTRYELEE